MVQPTRAANNYHLKRYTRPAKPTKSNYLYLLASTLHFSSSIFEHAPERSSSLFFSGFRLRRFTMQFVRTTIKWEKQKLNGI